MASFLAKREDDAMILKSMSSGPEVLALTERLKRLGLLDAAVDVYGPAVVDAVKIFQSKHCDPRGEPLVIDGVAGPMTEWAIRVSLGEAPAPAAAGKMPLTVPETGGSPIGRAALAVALAEYAAGAVEQIQDNDGPFVRKYQHNKQALDLQPWCASFVSWCLEQAAGGVSPLGYDASARGLYNRLKDRGGIFAANAASPPQPGDLIVWWREPIGKGYGHVGFVHSYENGIVRTIEGNRGDFPAPVGTYTYVLGRIERLLGFGRVS